MEACAIVPLAHTADPATVFEPTGGVVALVRVVRSVLGPVAEARIVVAAAPQFVGDARACLDAAGLAAVAVVDAPGSRPQTLAAGLERLALQPHSLTPVLVCDHRHPLAPRGVATRVLAALLDGRDAVMPWLPVTDTVKTVDRQGSVLGTVDRSALRTVQYPRGFTASALWAAVSGAGDSDELAAVLRAGLDVGTVDGDPDAFQVELPRDAGLLEAIIASRPG